MSSARPRKVEPGRDSRRRVFLLAGLVLSLFVVAALRAVHLQLVRAPLLRARADEQRTSRLELLAARGAIYDRGGRELARSIPGASVFVDPTCLLRAPGELERLCGALGCDPRETRRQLADGGSRFAWLKRRVSPREEEAVRSLRIPGVGIAREPTRYYPKKELAGQVLGFVGIDGRGLGGLEYRFDDVLRGRSQEVRAERDARGCLLLAEAPDTDWARGSSLVLTLDETVQHIAEEELARAVRESGARGGVAVLMEPHTGEIFALAQVPTFNPNAIAESTAGDRKIEAVVDVYEPGSTFKALFLGILLDAGLVRPDDLVFCENGQWATHDRVIHDHVPHGWLTVADVLKVSSNIGVAKLSEKLSSRAFYEGLQAFGIGEPTGIELAGESRGILPSPSRWSSVTAKTMAYGQGVSATALQVATAMAAIANGGVRPAPHLVRSVFDPDGRAAEQPAPQGTSRAISAEAATVLTRLMENVVQDEGGTGTRAAIPGYTVAGKTGTSWKPDPNGPGYLHGKVVASFAGFVPSRAPRLVGLVAVDEPSRGSRYGGMVAAPAFAAMCRRTLAYLQVPPTEDVAAVVTDRARRPERSAAEVARGVMPDVTGLTMREALRRLEASGSQIRLGLLGSGVAASQDPPAGTPLGADQACRIVFKPLL